jgi:3-hydroxybutyryl-CoA dehydratase
MGLEDGLAGYFLEDLSIGQTAELVRVASDEAVNAFAAISGDTNPLHLDQAFAETTQFKTRVAHGMLSGSYISAVLGTHLPGPGGIYLSQTLAFKRPVHIGDEVTARVTVTDIDAARGHVTFKTVCLVGGKAVVQGDAVVVVPRRDGPPAQAQDTAKA